MKKDKIMTIALYAGSFDPFTNGHLDILKQASEMFDEVIIAIACNPDKKEFLSLEVRLELIRKSISDLNNIRVDSFDGLTVDYARKNKASVLIRGMRNSKDFEYEKELALINKSLDSEIKTVFLIPKSENSIISSSMVREILDNRGDISSFVPKAVCDYFTYQ